jgi:hypothetical protein
MKRFRFVALLVALAGLGTFAPVGRAQSAAGASISSSDAIAASPDTTQVELNLAYQRPTQRTKLHNYLFDAFGPYPIAGAALSAGIDQAERTPPGWGQGAAGYGERVGSGFGIALVTTTTRYGLAEAFREDTLYYRCECTGVLRRLSHAVVSTVTARRGDDGHRRLSFPALFAPYAGSLTAVYVWYPSGYGYGAQYGLRMGNYTLLAFAGENIAREFIYGGPHTLFAHMDHSASRETESAAKSNP